MAAAIEFINVTKSFPNKNQPALDKVSLQIEDGELVTIIGTSGSGKTTLMKLVNRLHDPDSGEIKIFDNTIMQLNPIHLRRKIGYVIQQIGLFPHMTIYDNIATVPEMLGWNRQQIDERVHDLITLVNLESEQLLTRYPSQLSGGQQQRVGLARALAADPDIMLLDEPLGAIDAINREKLRQELVAIHEANQKTFLFITHDLHEAFKIGTKVLIMNEGRIEQYGTKDEILNQPKTPFVASFIEFYD